MQNKNRIFVLILSLWAGAMHAAGGRPADVVIRDLNAVNWVTVPAVQLTTPNNPWSVPPVGSVWVVDVYGNHYWITQANLTAAARVAVPPTVPTPALLPPESRWEIWVGGQKLINLTPCADFFRGMGRGIFETAVYGLLVGGASAVVATQSGAKSGAPVLSAGIALMGLYSGLKAAFKIKSTNALERWRARGCLLTSSLGFAAATFVTVASIGNKQ